jgi:hypothetical protein
VFTRSRFFALATIAIALGPVATPAQELMRDDFTDRSPSPDRWFVCQRDENTFSIEPVPGEPFNALALQVKPRQALKLFSLMQVHKECRAEDGDYIAGGDVERAEIWEAESTWLPFPTDVWYQFDMLIDPAIGPDTGRLVIGQWKQTLGNSPILAQRFTGRLFTVTIEQDNARDDRHPEDNQCRVVIAADRNARQPPGASLRHAFLSPTGGDEPLSQGHDAFDVAHGQPPGDPASSGCASDIKVTVFDSLPDVFGQWTHMLYHVRPGPDGTGLVEIEANGRPIARAEGRIGFRQADEGARQYFKFGPYRDADSATIEARIARFARGPRRQDLP